MVSLVVAVCYQHCCCLLQQCFILVSYTVWVKIFYCNGWSFFPWLVGWFMGWFLVGVVDGL